MEGSYEDALKDTNEVRLLPLQRLTLLEFTGPGNHGGPYESMGIRDKTRGTARFAALR